ncbi:LacI family DNA-binding transcriptional regulator [Microbacterium sp. SD291]|uniref:LacI family DNA-binding transcriptional regulator n=1 Tax=Microbacterium sp. SD291 TaxID=2782007 RepID=UPI001A96EE90|nr:LacI family DNA-binding transcriptional regulator [Microbacterium sp. SD291]MBO0981693.1 LacI family DNA-binding transcriptional regulator [Microbacterium sp. SD291]
MVTMQDVARHAGVSVMTVSNVINARPHVRDATRDRVLTAIDDLGYAVNAAARSLRQGRSGVIGLAIPDIDRPYFGQLAELIVARAAQDGYEVVIEHTGADREREIGALRHSRLRSYDGLLISAVNLSGADAALFRGELPVVVLGERSYEERVDHVVMANADGAGMIARHLIEQGARSLAMIGGVHDPAVPAGAGTLRAAGFVEAAEAEGVQVDRRMLVDCAYSFEGGLRSVEHLLGTGVPFDGLFCATDVLAIGAIRGLHERGISVPGDMLVAGFDDVPVARFTVPSVTSVAPDHAGMVDAALAMLVSRIAGERGADDYREHVSTARLQVRESTRRPRS